MQIGDVGTVLSFTILDENSEPVNLSTYLILQVLIRRPDGTLLEKFVIPTNGGADGIMSYTTITGDINQSGIYRFQGIISLSSGTWRTNIVSIVVQDNI